MSFTSYPLSIKKFFLLPFFLLIITGALIPSDGAHGLFSIKSLAFIFSCFAMGFYIVSEKKIDMKDVGLLLFLGIFLLFLFFWFWIGLISDDIPLHSQIDQFKLFVITVSVVLMTAYLSFRNSLTFSLFFKTLLFANFSYSFLKVFLVFAYVFNLLDTYTFMEATGIRFMSMSMAAGFSRLQTSVDILTPFLLFFVLQRDRFGVKLPKYFSSIYFFISALSILFSFSRFLMATALISVFLSCLNMRLKSWIKIFLGFICLIFCMISFFGVEGINNMIEMRLHSNANYHSDKIRTHQIEALLLESEKAPLLGRGLGSYAPDMIRDGTLLHSYEVQWVAFLMQFGLFGVCFILGAFGIIIAQFFTPPFTILKLTTAGLFFLWILSGFTNPFLISLTSGLIYALFFLAGRQIDQPSVS